MTSDSRLVLFKPSVGSAFGVVVDEISEIQTADSNRIEAFTGTTTRLPRRTCSRVDLIDSVCKLAGELLVVLNPRRFLAVVEQKLAVTT